MPPKVLTIGAPLAIVVAALWQLLINPLVIRAFGVGRSVQSLSEFPDFKCRKIIHPLLEGCEDLWLDEKDRKIYAACAAPEGRTAWQPTVNRRNVSGRTGRDHFVVLDIDHKNDFAPKKLTTRGYKGAIVGREAEIDLHGFDVEEVKAGSPALRFYVVNHRPPVDSITGVPLNAEELGCNSTVEVFDLERGSTELQWVRTYFDPEAVKTPNRVAATGEGGFVATNDHNTKTSGTRALESITGGGSLVYCGLRSCHLATGNFLKQPNGLTRSPKDGLYYVPSSADGYIRAFRLDPPGAASRRLRLVATIDCGMPMDNLMVDANGVIWAAAFPKVGSLLAGFDNPRTARPAAAALRVERTRDKGDGGEEVFEYKVTKVVEDKDGEVLPGTTTVLHDAKTKRLFFGGVYSPWISVCEHQ